MSGCDIAGLLRTRINRLHIKNVGLPNASVSGTVCCHRVSSGCVARCGAATLLSNISCCHGYVSLTLRQVININTQHENGHSWTVRVPPPPITLMNNREN